uniref:Elongation of very long chain fatty acids protein n=1 Tax=Denticeps clupeoides TaxID=299321 RepID=A0AAY4C351_9TELE
MVEEGITNILRFYDYLLRRTDSRVRDNPLMQSPIQMTLILLVYVFLVSWDICYTNVSTEKHSETWLLLLFHHSFMPWTWWWGITLTPGMGSFHAMVNACLHVIMYLCYGLAAAGPHIQKYLWWKKYMTTAQLIQFVVVSIHVSQYFSLKKCDYQVPVFISPGCMAPDLILFSNFWIQAYIKSMRLPVASVLSIANSKRRENSIAHHINGCAHQGKVKEV